MAQGGLHPDALMPLTLVVGAVGAVVVACSSSPPTAGPAVVAPAVAAWTCAEQRQARAELAAMPAGSVTPRMIADYLRMRDESRAARGEPEPAPCP
jgi:hypothetical protein